MVVDTRIEGQNAHKTSNEEGWEISTMRLLSRDMDESSCESMRNAIRPII